MRKVVLVVMMAVFLAGTANADATLCCKDRVTGAVQVYDGIMCPNGWDRVTCAPDVEPTVVPTPASWEPTPYSLPWYVKSILGWAAGVVKIPVVWGGVAAGIIAWVVAFLKQALAFFGKKLSPLALFIVTGGLAFFTVLGPAIADGSLSGSAEVTAVLDALIAWLCSFFGYKVTFSTKAVEWRNLRTAK